MPDYENDQDGPEETMGPSLMELMDGDPRLALPEGYGTELGDLMALNSGLSVDSMDDPMATDLPTTKPTTVTHSANPDPPTTPRKITIPNTGRPPSVPDFIAKLYRMLNDLSLSHIVTWSPIGHSFIVKDPAEFAKYLLPLHFKHNNFASFVRQLNKYDFHKVKATGEDKSAGIHQAWEFCNPLFQRDRPDLLETIKRKVAQARKPHASGSGIQSAPPSSILKKHSVASISPADSVAPPSTHKTRFQREDSSSSSVSLNGGNAGGSTLTGSNGNSNGGSYPPHNLHQHQSSATPSAGSSSREPPALFQDQVDALERSHGQMAENMATLSGTCKRMSERMDTLESTILAQDSLIKNLLELMPNARNNNNKPVTPNHSMNPSSSIPRQEHLSSPFPLQMYPMTQQQQQPQQQVPQQIHTQQPAQQYQSPHYQQQPQQLPVPQPSAYYQTVSPAVQQYNQQVQQIQQQNQLLQQQVQQLQQQVQQPPQQQQQPPTQPGQQSNPRQLPQADLVSLLKKDSLEGLLARYAHFGMFDQTAGAGFITSKFVPGTVQNDAPGPPPPPSIALLTTTHSGGTGNGPNLDATFNPSQFFAANKKNNNGNNSYNGYEQVGLVPVLRHQSSPSGSLTASVLTIPTPGSCPNAPLNQIRVLLVEDDDTCRRLSSKLLQIFGCNFDIAVDGLDAVNRMGVGYKYDIVLMDIVMPNLDGVSATTRIRQFDKLTPIISMTSNPTETDCITYLANGMNDILPKPFNKSSLLGMILRHVDKNKDTSPPPQDDGRITEVCDGPSMADEDLARRSNQAALVEASQSQNMNGDFDRQLLDLLRMDGNGEGSSSDNNINNNNAAGTDSRNMNIMNTLNPGYFPQNFDEPNRKRHHIEMDDGQDQKKNRR